MNTGLLAHKVNRSRINRSKITLRALLLTLLLTLAPALADATLHTALVPAAVAGGPQSGDGG
jgi:hypothetical protein